MREDLQAFVDSIAAMTCVISVERLPDGSCGTIRIVTGNRAYIDSVEHPPEGMTLLADKFIPNCEYTRYLTKDLNFEEYSYRSAVRKECLHSYIHPDRLNAWLSITFMPLSIEEETTCYCTYTMEIDHEANSERLTRVRGDFAAQILEDSIILRSSDDFSVGMAQVVDKIRDMCQAEYCCIMLVDEESRSCQVLAEHIADGSLLKPMATYIDDDFYDIAESWKSTISGSYCLVAKDEADMNVVKERNPQWHSSLVQASVGNIVLFPLKSRGNLLGYIWAVNFEAEKSDLVRESLELATYVLATEIDNQLLVRDLRTMGSQDMLTGVMNRNEMNNRVDALAEGKEDAGLSVGVVYADLNGLKAVNDGDGHAAGDKLLIDAVEVLVDVFGQQAIYRAGGDEFVIILADVSDADLAKKVDAVQEKSKKYERLSFALGCSVVPNGREIQKALQEADVRMYEDKAAHYARSGEARRTVTPASTQ